MSLIKCKECGNEISSKADSCPKCGVNLKPKSSGCFVQLFTTVFGAIGAIIGLLVAVSYLSKDDKVIDPVQVLESRCRQLSEPYGDISERNAVYSSCVTAGKGALKSHGVNIPSTTAVCKVNDTDIATEYTGGCSAGLANGKGVAKGRDEYIGQFKHGEPHGKGTYVWGSGSVWTGDRYVGEWKNGARTGKGSYSSHEGYLYEGEFIDGKYSGFGILKIPRNSYVASERSALGKWIGDSFIEQGLFGNNKLILHCPSMNACTKFNKKTNAPKDLPSQ